MFRLVLLPTEDIYLSDKTEKLQFRFYEIKVLLIVPHLVESVQLEKKSGLFAYFTFNCCSVKCLQFSLGYGGFLPVLTLTYLAT